MTFSLPNNLQWIPGGRLTLTTALPVLSSSVTGATSIYYTPYVHNIIPIYDSTLGVFVPTIFSELTNVTTNSTTNPAACTTNSNYDLFVWSSAGTLTLSRGPAWSSDTSRGTGAGTTQLTRVNGVWTNTVAITNGPGAGLGTYVGTIRTDGSSQVNWTPVPSASAGGTEAKLHVFNAYNRIRIYAQSRDNTSSWTYGTSTWRSMNNSTGNRISYIDGLGEIYIDASLSAFPSSSGCNGDAGINRDSTSSTPPNTMVNSFSASGFLMTVRTVFTASLGYHYLQAVEYGDGGTTTWYSTWVTQVQAQSLNVSADL
jgi:hypothetical protein